MRTSVAISWQETDFGAVARGDASALINHARRLGYDAVELAVRDPSIVDTAQLEKVLDGLPVSAIGTGQAFLSDRLSLTDKDAEVRRAAVERLAGHCHLAAGLNCSLVIIGLIRGRNGNREYLIDGLKQVCGFAESVGVRLVVEPINRYETDLVNTAAQAADIIGCVGTGNLGMLLDTFHMNIEETNPAAALVSHRERLWHVHLADSNRQAPGSGHLDFREVIGLLHALRYEGYLSAEIMPRPDAATAMKMALDNMRQTQCAAA